MPRPFAAVEDVIREVAILLDLEQDDPRVLGHAWEVARRAAAAKISVLSRMELRGAPGVRLDDSDVRRLVAVALAPSNSGDGMTAATVAG